MVKRLLAATLALCIWTVLLSTVAWATSSLDSGIGIDHQVYDTCEQITDMARQIMPAADYEHFLSLSDLECVSRFGDMTRSQLKAYLASKSYQAYWKLPMYHGEALQIDADADYTFIDNTKVYNHLHDDGVQHIHSIPLDDPRAYRVDDEEGHYHEEEEGIASGAHEQQAWVWLAHRWYNAGVSLSDLRVAFDIKHHYRHFDGSPRDFGIYYTSRGRDDGWYVFYDDVSVSGSKRNFIDDGGFTQYRLTVKYRFQRCLNSDQTDCGIWRSRTRHKTCKASTKDTDEHITDRRQCYALL